MVDKWVMATKETIVFEATPESINSVVLNEVEEGVPSIPLDDLDFFYPHASLELSNQHQGLALHYPSPITGFSSGVGGFWGINCDNEEHDGVSD
ncbi:hypothetical protein Tco_1284609 [Tanacetum coccineum]